MPEPERETYAAPDEYTVDVIEKRPVKEEDGKPPTATTCAARGGGKG